MAQVDRTPLSVLSGKIVQLSHAPTYVIENICLFAQEKSKFSITAIGPSSSFFVAINQGSVPLPKTHLHALCEWL